MSYGHFSILFLDADEARRYVNDCKRHENRTAENYQDRLAAFRCIKHFTSHEDDDVKLSSSITANEGTRMAKERTEKPLPEFVKITKVGQTVAGKITRFGKGSLGTYFAILEPGLLRDVEGGQWDMFGSFAVNLSTDMIRKVDPAKDSGKFFVFKFASTEQTSKGGTKKIFKVLELEPDEERELIGKAKNHGDKAPPQAVPENAAKDDDEATDDY